LPQPFFTDNDKFLMIQRKTPHLKWSPEEVALGQAPSEISPTFPRTASVSLRRFLWETESNENLSIVKIDKIIDNNE